MREANVKNLITVTT